MNRSFPRTARTAALALCTAALASCGGDNVLGPPDGPGCTVGSIAPGDSVNGTVGASSCQAFDISSYNLTYADSWTLQATKNTVYIIRLRHQADTAAFDNWDGDLEVYARNAQGDPNFVTGWYGSFGAVNGNGGRNQELFLVADANRTYSVRVSASSTADTGAYSLAVTSCPLTVIADTLARTGIDLATGCPALSLDALPTKVTFFGFPSDSSVSDTVFATRTAGTGTFWSRLAGPAPDFSCWNDDCDSRNVDFGTSATMALIPNLPGTAVYAAVVRADSAATISVTGHVVPPAAATAPFTTARTTGIHRGGR